MAAQAQAGAAYFGAALRIIQNLYGWIVNEVESTPNILTTSPTSPFLPQNADRIGLVIANFGANNVYISINQQTVGAVAGILLQPSGGIVSMNLRDDWTLITRNWWGVTVNLAQNIYVLEIIGVRPFAPGTLPGVV